MKSIETKFAEAMDAIKKAKRTKQFEEASKKCTTIEAKLNAAEAVLKDVGVVRESTPIRKHNGVADNISEGNPLRLEEWRESANNPGHFSPGYTNVNTAAALAAKSNKIMADGWLKAGKITEAEHRKMIGAKPEGYDQLTEQQKKEFDHAQLFGFNEVDAFKVAKRAGGTFFKEVSR